MAFLQQLPALIGVVVGALGSYFAVSSNERARFRREQAVRWDQRRMDAYANYSRTVQTAMTLLWRVAAHRGIDPHPEPLSPADSSPLLAAAWAERDVAWETLRLLGAPEVIAAARAWHVHATAVQRYATGHAPATAELWRAAIVQAQQGRQHYYELARKDLAIREAGAR